MVTTTFQKWPVTGFICDEEDILKEKKRIVSTLIPTQNNDNDWY